MTSHFSDADVIAVLKEAARAVRSELAHLGDWGPTGGKKGQYRCDLVADDAAVRVIRKAGMGVVSEESGVHDADNPILVVLDPVDGSTNASQGIPWWATSLCAVDVHGLRASVVVNQASGKVYEAVRGGGALVDGAPLETSGSTELSQSIIGISGYPRRYLGWNQFRALGAAALDLCAVAEGVLDAYADCTQGSLAPWDYLGAMLVCREAGASIADRDGADLVTTDHGARRAPIAAATPELLAQLTKAVSAVRDA